jgi:hypothetical protein
MSDIEDDYDEGPGPEIDFAGEAAAAASGTKRMKSGKNKRSKKGSALSVLRAPDDERLQRYAEGPVKAKTPSSVNPKFKRLRKTLEETNEKIFEAATAAVVADEVLLTEAAGFIQADRERGERVYKLRQSQMRPLLDLNTSKNMMDLYLTKFGPYRCSYSRNGRYV